MRTLPSGATVSSAVELVPGRLWSLWEMLTFFARPFIQMGEQLHDVKLMLAFNDADPDAHPLDAEELNDLLEHFGRLVELCDSLDMPISKALLLEAKNDPPRTEREYAIIKSALDKELLNKLLVFVPSHRRKYFHHRDFVDPIILKAFPGPHAELRSAGQSFAVGLYTATVFHAMRAVEVGLRSMASDLEVTLPEGIENAQWETLIRHIESKIQAMKDLPKTPEKADLLHFYSDASMQFRYFKDGWRVRAAHSKATFDEPQAKIAVDHAQEFFKMLATKLKEPSA
jgi:HEPN domain-containing protein